MSKTAAFLPEPLAWLAGLTLAGALALPLALAENSRTWASLWLPPKAATPSVRIPEKKINIPTAEPLKISVWPDVREDPPALEAEEAAFLAPTPGLLDDLRGRVRPQVAFSSAADEFEDLIETTARAHQVSPLLVKAVIQAESRFDPSAVSNKGAVGLMQVLPSTARAEGVHDLLDPKMNLEAGVRHLKKLLQSFNDDEKLALAAYNCGQEAMRKFNNEVPPFPETRNYVNRVMSYYSQHLES
ncbi:MAG: lytic transglycosylase domain-containing protein [Candidatus Adiutrix sp.]|jgi:soluble lytic murein transglycosylase-like protein|nr:lytic transglycosylase domain-containing protein [Candidatus Adiutrix sp.]